MSEPMLANLVIGSFNANVYTFVTAGDELPEHDHDELTKHLTIVLKGDIQIRSNQTGIHKLGGGQIYAFAAGERHAIKALNDGAKIMNIVY